MHLLFSKLKVIFSDIRIHRYRKICPFHIEKMKVNNFIVVVTLLNTFLILSVFHSPSFQCLSCMSFQVKNFYYFWGGRHLFGDLFFIFTENTLKHWKSHYRQNQIVFKVFNSRSLIKKLLWMFLASPTQTTHHETFEFFIENYC